MSSPRPDDAAIREQAYYFWEQDGRPEGRETEYWMRATIVLGEKPQMDTLTEATPTKAAKTGSAPKLKAAASNAKTPPVKSAKVEPKAKPKKK